MKHYIRYVSILSTLLILFAFYSCTDSQFMQSANGTSSASAITTPTKVLPVYTDLLGRLPITVADNRYEYVTGKIYNTLG